VSTVNVKGFFSHAVKFIVPSPGSVATSEFLICDGEKDVFTSVRFFEENSWPLDCVRKKETVETLDDLVHPQILSQVFDIIVLGNR
jgi:hypothetical protein